jgi:hypothetical protein
MNTDGTAHKIEKDVGGKIGMRIRGGIRRWGGGQLSVELGTEVRRAAERIRRRMEKSPR